MSPWSWELQAARAGVLRLAHELAGVQQRLRAQEKLQEDGHGPMVMALRKTLFSRVQNTKLWS